MTDFHQKNIQAYEAAFGEHGDSPAAVLCAKGRQHLRFQPLLSIVKANKDFSLCDFGCGLAHLLPYLRAVGWKGHYHGLDVVKSFIDHGKAASPQNARFTLVDPEQPLAGHYDVVFSSGVFNLQTHLDKTESKKYALDRILQLFGMAGAYLVCDFMTEYVDFKQPGAQHFSPREITDFAVANLSRRFILRHDLMPFEFTLICYRDAGISRPDNVYGRDALL